MLREMGRAYWDTKLPDYARSGFLPDDYDDTVWTPALDVQLPTVGHTPYADWWDATSWVLATDDVPASLAEETARFFGDPDSVGAVVLHLPSLPEPVAAALGGPGRPADDGSHSHRARRVREALTGATPVHLDRWQHPGPVDWRARANDRVAVHVPRLLPEPERIGEPLEVTIVPGQPGEPAVGITSTDTGQAALLPGIGAASNLAAAIEHVVWHPGLPVPLSGLRGNAQSKALVDALAAVLATGGSTMPWRQLVTLVPGHPTRNCFITGCPTRSR